MECKEKKMGITNRKNLLICFIKPPYLYEKVKRFVLKYNYKGVLFTYNKIIQ
jgi:hypothetical protein